MLNTTDPSVNVLKYLSYEVFSVCKRVSRAGRQALWVLLRMWHLCVLWLERASVSVWLFVLVNVSLSLLLLCPCVCTPWSVCEAPCCQHRGSALLGGSHAENSLQPKGHCSSHKLALVKQRKEDSYQPNVSLMWPLPTLESSHLQNK